MGVHPDQHSGTQYPCQLRCLIYGSGLNDRRIMQQANPVMLVGKGAQNQAADAAKSVDGKGGGHGRASAGMRWR